MAIEQDQSASLEYIKVTNSFHMIRSHSPLLELLRTLLLQECCPAFSQHALLIAVVSLPDSRFAVECSELKVHPSKPSIIHMYSAKDGSKHLELFECLNVLFEHSPGIVPVQNHRS